MSIDFRASAAHDAPLCPSAFNAPQPLQLNFFPTFSARNVECALSDKTPRRLGLHVRRSADMISTQYKKHQQNLSHSNSSNDTSSNMHVR